MIDDPLQDSLFFWQIVLADRRRLLEIERQLVRLVGNLQNFHAGCRAIDERQTAVRVLAGVLRLARALRKSGLESAVGLRCEKSAEALALSVPGLLDTAEIAARLAAAKHLLESVLEKPLLLKSVPKPEKTPAPIVHPSGKPQVADAPAPA